MQTFIVSTNGALGRWRQCFHSTFQDDHHQESIIHELLKISNEIPDSKNQQHISLSLSLSCMEYVNELNDSGMIKQEDLQYTTKIAKVLTNYFIHHGKHLSPDATLQFEGFTQMDIIVIAIPHNEAYDQLERLCLTG